MAYPGQVCLLRINALVQYSSKHLRNRPPEILSGRTGRVGLCMVLRAQPVGNLEVDVVERHSRGEEIAKNPHGIILAKDEVSETHQTPDDADYPEHERHDRFLSPS